MSEYWKSNAKKFCQICKTWYADNKISIENHERGTKHKVMVQQRLREGAQKAERQEREKAELNKTLLQMERAAMASMSAAEQERIAQEPSNAKPLGPRPPTKLELERSEFKAQKRKLEELKKTAAHSQFWDNEGKTAVYDGNWTAEPAGRGSGLEREWVQAQHHETGQCYYWHIYSGETRWDEPTGNFYTTVEYNEKYAEIAAEAATKAAFSGATPHTQIPAQFVTSAANSASGFAATSLLAASSTTAGGMKTETTNGEAAASAPTPSEEEEDDGVPKFTAMPSSSLAGNRFPMPGEQKSRKKNRNGDEADRKKSHWDRRRENEEKNNELDVNRQFPVRIKLESKGGNGDIASQVDPALALADIDLPPPSGPTEIVKEEEEPEPQPLPSTSTESEENSTTKPKARDDVTSRAPKPAPALGPWVPVIKEKVLERVITDLPKQVAKKKASEIVEEMEMDPSELSFQEKVLPTVAKKKSSKTIEFKKRSFANKGNLRARAE